MEEADVEVGDESDEEDSDSTSGDESTSDKESDDEEIVIDETEVVEIDDEIAAVGAKDADDTKEVKEGDQALA